ncbi:sigma-70 family RNA polymerase sigma factor [uncultured Microbulbifer sp.]|uniref:sigma-70 family RNA polymerase sigma factor n=1 Tax=uncultured Microbulbifer sp. TaxID=348147 RepID=UPI0026091DDD|nr:sigma-70 family RNA polymerase sigma factor [uncultured Microbulbifer sp.]
MSTEDSELIEKWDALSGPAIGCARTWLYEYYKDYSFYLARRIYSRRKFTGVDVEDLYQWASIGLLEAIDRYDRKRSVNFKTYASFRIKGSIINGLGSYSERLSFFSESSGKISSGENNNTDEKDLESDLLNTIVSATLDFGYAYILDNYWCLEDSVSIESPYASPEYSAFLLEMTEKLEKMSNVHQEIIRMKYVEEASFAEIAKHLCLSKTRIVQLHVEAINTLRKLMNKNFSLEC